MIDHNKDVARQVIERIFMRQEDAAIDELISPTFVPEFDKLGLMQQLKDAAPS